MFYCVCSPDADNNCSCQEGSEYHTYIPKLFTTHLREQLCTGGLSAGPGAGRLHSPPCSGHWSVKASQDGSSSSDCPRSSVKMNQDMISHLLSFKSASQAASCLPWMSTGTRVSSPVMDQTEWKPICFHSFHPRLFPWKGGSVANDHQQETGPRVFERQRLSVYWL